ncbi:hypothetical protein EXIGLDRAFT_716624 [Exidia glandulosa HHB12029]|uniref:Uncharacterized protein n=1 Tax=Exidia glandulosa HHB12029 TaxID=1314781 RepID=A0A165ITZ8_EXIGL|nr:hypothetical protein EXIGLDRAFT_716624 [Exidia glandulosa HHB12029]
MRFAPILLLALPAAASWFGSDKPDYLNWNKKQLKDWLNDRNIHVPNGFDNAQLQELVKSNWDEGSAWTQDQYTQAQKTFQDVKQSSFDSWDESRLRQFLLEQGVVAPSSKKEELVLLANKQYKSFKAAASSYASQASATASSAYYGSPASQVSASASSVAGGAASSVSSVAGNAASSVSSVAGQASASASSVIAQATDSVVRTLDDSKDYVYSTWDDSQLRSYLHQKGVIRTDTEIKRDQLLAKMRDAYASVTEPVWAAWSDSYMHEWLVAHGIIKSDYEKKRDQLTGLMQQYYYGTNDYVWSTWDDSTLKGWLVEHNIVKSSAQVKREKMLKLVQDNYNSASDTVYGGWKDSEMRQWLIDNGYMKSDAQAKRDELVKLMSSKYNDAQSRVASYTTWPDARLRAFLRNHGITEASMPKSRADLLHETRIRWVQTQWASESLYRRIKDTITGGVETAEEKLGKVLEILGGAKHDVGNAGAKATERAKHEL